MAGHTDVVQSQVSGRIFEEDGLRVVEDSGVVYRRGLCAARSRVLLFVPLWRLFWGKRHRGAIKPIIYHILPTTVSPIGSNSSQLPPTRENTCN